MESSHCCVSTMAASSLLVLILASRHDRLFDKVHIVLVGKYTTLQDSYTSVVKSLEHASLQCARKLSITVSKLCDSAEAHR